MEYVPSSIKPVRRREGHALLCLIVLHAVVACGGGSSPSPAQNAAKATLSWSASPSDDVVGYRIYQGTAPGHYLQVKGAGTDVGRVTSHVVTDLVPGTRYHFAVTAYAADGSESAYSAEASKVVE